MDKSCYIINNVLSTLLLSVGQLDVILYDRRLSLPYHGRYSGEHSAPSLSAPHLPLTDRADVYAALASNRELTY